MDEPNKVAQCANCGEKIMFMGTEEVPEPVMGDDLDYTGEYNYIDEEIWRHKNTKNRICASGKTGAHPQPNTEYNECPACGGDGGYNEEPNEEYQMDGGWRDCGVCGGTGEVNPDKTMGRK